MRRIDLLAAYRVRQRARFLPLVTAAAILLAGVIGLAGYGLYAYRQMAGARLLLNNAQTTAGIRSRLQDQVDGAAHKLEGIAARLEKKQARVDADRRVLGEQARAVASRRTNAAATLVRVSGIMPPASRWSRVEIAPDRVLVEGFGLDAVEVMRRLQELRRGGLRVELQRLLTRRRGDERLLFYRLSLSHLAPRRVPGNGKEQ